jgi:hypothetical protein
MKRTGMAVVCLTLLLILSSSSADTVSVALDTAVSIAGQIQGQTRGRVLAKITIPNEVAQGQIDFAMLQLPPIQLPDTHVRPTIAVHRVTTNWASNNVTWDAPWRTPGGDYDSICLTQYFIAAGDTHRIMLDITKCVQEWQGGAANYGIILKRPPGEGDGFDLEASNLLEALRSARVKYYYHHVW